MKKIHESKNSKKFNATINKVHEEMNNAEKIMNNWNVRWNETFSDAYCYDLQFLTEDEIAWLGSMYDNRYDLTNGGDVSSRIGAALKRETLVDEKNEEYVCEFRKVEWLVTNNKIVRNLTFGNTGDISYSSVKRKRNANDESYDYYAGYNVNDTSLAIRFVRCNEDFVVLYEGDRRIINSDGVQFIEDSNGIEISTSLNDMKYTVKIDPANRIDSKILVDGNDTYVFCGSELISVTRSSSEGVEELKITPELILDVDKKLEAVMIGKFNKYELLTFISNVKLRLSNAIKSVKNDVPLVGLSKRLDILLAMIYTKSEAKEEVKGTKKR